MIPSNVWRECKWQPIPVKSAVGDPPSECWFREHVLGIQWTQVAECETFLVVVPKYTIYRNDFN